MYGGAETSAASRAAARAREEAVYKELQREARQEANDDAEDAINIAHAERLLREAEEVERQRRRQLEEAEWQERQILAEAAVASLKGEAPASAAKPRPQSNSKPKQQDDLMSQAVGTVARILGCKARTNERAAAPSSQPPEPQQSVVAAFLPPWPGEDLEDQQMQAVMELTQPSSQSPQRNDGSIASRELLARKLDAVMEKLEIMETKVNGFDKESILASLQESVRACQFSPPQRPASPPLHRVEETMLASRQESVRACQFSPPEACSASPELKPSEPQAVLAAPIPQSKQQPEMLSSSAECGEDEHELHSVKLDLAALCDHLKQTFPPSENQSPEKAALAAQAQAAEFYAAQVREWREQGDGTRAAHDRHHADDHHTGATASSEFDRFEAEALAQARALQEYSSPSQEPSLSSQSATPSPLARQMMPSHPHEEVDLSTQKSTPSPPPRHMLAAHTVEDLHRELEATQAWQTDILRELQREHMREREELQLSHSRVVGQELEMSRQTPSHSHILELEASWRAAPREPCSVPSSSCSSRSRSIEPERLPLRPSGYQQARASPVPPVPINAPPREHQQEELEVSRIAAPAKVVSTAENNPDVSMGSTGGTGSPEGLAFGGSEAEAKLKATSAWLQQGAVDRSASSIWLRPPVGEDEIESDDANECMRPLQPEPKLHREAEKSSSGTGVPKLNLRRESAPAGWTRSESVASIDSVDWDTVSLSTIGGDLDHSVGNVCRMPRAKAKQKVRRVKEII
eukprot:gnl/TRDRNA2_/TRDRNA2_169061_c0_seq2.p1 gnl/TRDRNA2_/TRDRNA2_169061_c0~~gnl/TRDRNA2_/TRDRNA2_169061_c0_seq2.p1  ORF type:complete len:850 (-),score=181.77 gnl/TRDRNA2_/TRDRNA2_169061_c0_seq2:169-2424(-)